MRKLFFLFAVILLLPACRTAEQDPDHRTTLEVRNLKGSVHTVELTTYYNDGENGEILRTGVMRDAYDRNGMVVETEFESDTMAGISRTTYKYDGGSMLAEVTYGYGDSRSRKVIERKKGRIVAQKTYDADGNMLGYSVFEKISGDVEKMTSYNAAGGVGSIQTTVKETPWNYTTEMVSYDDDEEIFSTVKLVYVDGQEIENISIFAGDTIRIVNVYGLDGDQVQVLVYENDDLEQDFRMEYEYDDRWVNWVKMYIYDNKSGEFLGTQERVITYYAE